MDSRPVRGRERRRGCQAKACNFTKINTPPWVFFTFFKLYKWYQIAQRTTYYQYAGMYIAYFLRFSGNDKSNHSEEVLFTASQLTSVFLIKRYHATVLLSISRILLHDYFPQQLRTKITKVMVGARFLIFNGFFFYFPI